MPEQRNKNYIFISYSHKDEKLMLKIREHLINGHINFWVDARNIRGGTEWNDEIRDAIDKCTAALVILSAFYDKSENCMHEASRIKDQRKPVLEIRLCGSDYSFLHPWLPEYLDQFQRHQMPSRINQKAQDALFHYLDDSPHVQMCFDISSPSIRKIAFVGGPGAGKEEAAAMAASYIRSKGLTCLLIPETAGEFVRNGISPDTCRNWYFFQKAVFEAQLLREKEYQKIAEDMNVKDVILICSGGLLDGKAYLNVMNGSDKQFDQILKDNHCSYSDLLGSYDGVFFLSGTKHKAPDATNTFEHAGKISNMIHSVWKEHHFFRVIPSRYSSQEREREIQDEIDSFLNDFHISRKYLIKMPDLKKLQKKVQPSEIMQTYLVPDADHNLSEDRIRMKKFDQEITYVRKRKTWMNAQLQKEERISLTAQEYTELLMERKDPSRHTIRKQRYRFTYKNQTIDLDVYPEWKDRALLEISVNYATEEMMIPGWIQVIQDVTDDPSYRNSSLAEEGSALHRK